MSNFLLWPSASSWHHTPSSTIIHCYIISSRSYHHHHLPIYVLPSALLGPSASSPDNEPSVQLVTPSVEALTKQHGLHLPDTPTTDNINMVKQCTRPTWKYLGCCCRRGPPAEEVSANSGNVVINVNPTGLTHRRRETAGRRRSFGAIELGMLAIAIASTTMLVWYWMRPSGRRRRRRRPKENSEVNVNTVFSCESYRLFFIIIACWQRLSDRASRASQRVPAIIRNVYLGSTAYFGWSILSNFAWIRQDSLCSLQWYLYIAFDRFFILIL